MKEFSPDYRHIEKAAKNIETDRLPLYEHNISVGIVEQVLNHRFGDLIQGDDRDVNEFFRQYNRFFREMGYDIVSYECCIGEVMPGSGCLGRHAEPVIRDRADFENIRGIRLNSVILIHIRGILKRLQTICRRG